MPSSKYKQHLSSPEWQRIRSIAIRRTGGRCFMCLEKKPLDGHHASYKRLGHEHHVQIYPLCRSCHEMWHKHLSRPMQRRINKFWRRFTALPKKKKERFLTAYDRQHA